MISDPKLDNPSAVLLSRLELGSSCTSLAG